MGNSERIRHVAARVLEHQEQGESLVVVVSAMQGETDRLMALARAICEDPAPRELDQLLATGEQAAAALLAMALESKGVRARSLTGSQMRLRTDGHYFRARILALDGPAIEDALSAGEVVVATGFQGIDRDGNLTTLGRGGSDTSAVALAAALGAQQCEIYTDVPGVFTADPNLCPNACKLDEIAFDEMLELASQGTKVLQIRCVELAMNHDIPLRVRSTFDPDPGTLVCAEHDGIERLVVRGVSYDKNEVKVTLRRVPDHPGIAARIFSALAEAQINVDVIVQNTSEAGSTDLSFTVTNTDHRRAAEITRAVGQKINAGDVEVDPSIAKVSIVGVGMRSHPGVAASMFEALHEAQVNIQMITTSEIKVTCVIDRAQVEVAVRALHDCFELHLLSSSEAKGKGKKKAAKKPRKKAGPGHAGRASKKARA